MSLLINFWLPALVVSSASLIALGLVGETSVGFRTTLAVIGLLAWFVPWSLIMLPAISSHGLPLTQWIDTTPFPVDTGVGSTIARTPEGLSTTQTGPWWLLLFAPGALLFPFDLVRRAWRLQGVERESSDGEWLRPLLPDHLQSIPARIRIIPGANAMATGVFRGTVWVGEDLCGHPDLKAVLVHECFHLKRKDTVRILSIQLARRLYWFNPVVSSLSRTLLRLLEQACDVESAAVLGRTNYQRSLARLMVDTNSPRVILVPSVFGASNDFRRVHALDGESVSGLRRFSAILLILIAGFVAVNVSAQQRDPRTGEWREDRDSPNFIGLYTIYEDLGNGMTRVHATENLAPQYRLHSDQRCDGEFYPDLDAEGVPTDISRSCRVLDARTVTFKLMRRTSQGMIEGESTMKLSRDGNHFSTVVEWKDADGKVVQTSERRFTRNSENCLNHVREDLFRACKERSHPVSD